MATWLEIATAAGRSREMTTEFTTENDIHVKLRVRRLNSGEEGEEDYLEVDMDGHDGIFYFNSYEQAREFLVKFGAMLDGFEVGPVTRRIQRLEAENAELRREIVRVEKLLAVEMGADAAN